MTLPRLTQRHHVSKLLWQVPAAPRASQTGYRSTQMHVHAHTHGRGSGSTHTWEHAPATPSSVHCKPALCKLPPRTQIHLPQTKKLLVPLPLHVCCMLGELCRALAAGRGAGQGPSLQSAACYTE